MKLVQHNPPPSPLPPSPPCIFFPNPYFWQQIILVISPPMKSRINRKINSGGKVISSCLEDYTTFRVFLATPG